MEKRYLDGNQDQQGVGMWTDHAASVQLVLDLSTGTITPKYHVIFDDHFNTVTATEGEVPDFTSDPWYKMFGEAIHQYHVDEMLEEEASSVQVHPNPVQAT